MRYVLDMDSILGSGIHHVMCLSSVFQNKGNALPGYMLDAISSVEHNAHYGILAGSGS